MPTLLLRGPEGPQKDDNQQAPDDRQDDRSHADASRHDNRQRRSPKPAILSPEDCARGMSQLPGLVAIGMLSPSQANSMRAAYHEIQQFHRENAKVTGNGLPDATVQELMRRDPTTLSLLEPVLTSEQVDIVMKHSTEAAGGAT